MGALSTSAQSIKDLLSTQQPPPEQQQDGQGYTEPSSIQPVTETVQDKLKAMGAKDPDKVLGDLIKIRRLQKSLNAPQRRAKIMSSLKAIEYDKGNQYIVPDPYSTSWYDPFSEEAGSGEASGTEQGKGNPYVYRYQTNIIQWLRGVFVAALSAAIPRVEYWPDDAESDLDNRASQTRSRAARMIGRQNDEKAMLKLALDNLFLTGSYFRYTRWSMDPKITGFAYEDTVDWQAREVLPNRYSCPDCGQDTPVDLSNFSPDQKQQCMNCGGSLDSSNFQPAQKVNMPVVTGQRKVPKGQVRQSIYSCLQWDMDVYADLDGGSPMDATPVGDLECEISAGALRQMYPLAWDKVKSGQTDTSNPDGDITRNARLRAYSPSLVRNISGQWQRPTYHRTWFQPESFNLLEKKQDADLLQELFPDGCCLSTINDDSLDIRAAELTKEWTWGGTKNGVGAYPPAVVQTAMDFQDRINDIANTIHEYNDRLACPPILYNPKMVGEGLSGMFLAPGSMVPAPANPDMQRGLADAFFQPKFSLDNGIYGYAESLMTAVQLLTGITPQTYGGTQEGIETATGQEQALKTAMGVLWRLWDGVRGEHAQAAEIAVDCLAKNASDDMRDVVEGEDSPGFKNEDIRLADLDGHARAYPDADQGYPIGFEQERDLYRQMLLSAGNGSKGNELILEMLDDFENQRLMMRYLGPPDMVLPIAKARDKVLSDIAMLVEQEPTEGMDPTGQSPVPVQLPSVMPDPDFDFQYPKVLIATAIKYGLKNYDELRGTPALENLRLYIKLAAFFEARKSAQDQMGVAPPNLQPGGPQAGTSAPPQLTAGSQVGPTPMPPQPNPPTPMKLVH